jgi:hypothetical protein
MDALSDPRQAGAQMYWPYNVLSRDRRPTALDRCGQLEPIHGTRHLDVREDHSDVEPILEDEDSFVGVLRFVDIETGSTNHIDRVHANQELVLDDQNDVPLGL